MSHEPVILDAGSASLLGTPIELDLVWMPPDGAPHLDCKDDPTRYAHVDLESKAFSFAACRAKKVVIERRLDDREAAALAELVSRLPRGAAPKSIAPIAPCPRLHWRGTEGEHETGWQLCVQPTTLSTSAREEAIRVEDVMNLLAGASRSPSRDGICGGPLSHACKQPAACGSRNGIVPYAFGTCSSGSSVVCAAIAYCPFGWKDCTLSEEECTKAPHRCRFVSAGCADERLCEKCGATEVCPGGERAPE